MKMQYFIKNLLATTALVGSTQIAFADCVETDLNYVCSGVTVQLELSQDNSSVLIEPDSAIYNIDGDGIKSKKDDITITVYGGVVASEEAIQSRGDRTRISVVGSRVEGDDNAIDVKKSDGSIVENSGLIQGRGRKGIKADDATNFTLTNYSGGGVYGRTEGIEAGDNAIITNHQGATIEGLTDDAVNVGEGATVHNHGTILADDDGIDIDSGSIINTGEIKAKNGDGIDVDASSVGGVSLQNDGVISGRLGVRIEDGSGGEANTYDHTIINNGVISGLDGVSVWLGSGNDFVGGAGVFNGQVRLGAGQDVFDIGSYVLKSSSTSGYNLLLAGEGGNDTLLNFAKTGNSILVGASILQDVVVLGYSSAGTSADYLVVADSFEYFASGNDVLTAQDVVATYGDLGLFQPAPVPLPASALLLGGALVGLGALRRR